MSPEDQLREFAHAVADYIIEMDKIMKGPSTYERGRVLAQNLSKLQRVWEDADRTLNPPNKIAFGKKPQPHASNK